MKRPDSSLGYGTDQLQRGLYKATDVFGRLTGIEALEQWGKEGADAQLEDMQAGRYEPFHTKSLRETYNQDGLIAALDWTREKAIENAPSYTIGVGGTALGVGLGLLGFVPAAAIAGLVTVAGTIFQGTGEVALEMEEKTGDYNTLLSVGAGTFGILDKIGAGKIINKNDLAKMGVGELIQKLRTEGSRKLQNSLFKKHFLSQAH